VDGDLFVGAVQDLSPTGTIRTGSLVAGTLSVTGGATFEDDITVNGATALFAGDTVTTGSVTVAGGLTISDALYTTVATHVFGDSLNIRPGVGYAWTDFYETFYGSGGSDQCGDLTNAAIGGRTIQTILADVYNSTVVADAIVWVGFNTWMAVSQTLAGLRGHILAVGAIGAFTMFKPERLTTATAAGLGVTLGGTWGSPSGGLGWTRGVVTTDPAATFSFPVDTRYVWLQYIVGAAVSTGNSMTWTIDGDATESTEVGVADGVAAIYYPADIIIDRGAALIGTMTTFTLNAITGSASPQTFVVGFVTTNTLPATRTTIVGPWHSPGTGTHTLGGVPYVAAIDATLRSVVASYRSWGLDMRYVTPPAALTGDWLGQGTTVIHANRQYTPRLARAIGRVALAPATTHELDSDFSIPALPVNSRGIL
jgi:hypothetical protein